MININNWNGIGNITKDLELRYSGSGVAVLKFTVAINSGWGDNKRVDYPNVVCFKKIAENCAQYLEKGSKVGIEGRIQTGSYDDKEGRKVYTTEIIADRIEFLNTKDPLAAAKETFKGAEERDMTENGEIPF